MSAIESDQPVMPAGETREAAKTVQRDGKPAKVSAGGLARIGNSCRLTYMPQDDHEPRDRMIPTVAIVTRPCNWRGSPPHAGTDLRFQISDFK
jgi:hypothetical protein